MKKVVSVMISVALVLGILTGCGAETETPSFKVELVVDIPGVYSVYYTSYIDGARAGSGAEADLDHQELEQGRVLEYEFTPALFDEGADLSKFAIDFSPFDNESEYELGRTNIVAFPAEYGQTYRIHLVHDETGYYAVPEWEEEEEEGTGETFSLEIGGEVMPDKVDFSYLQADYFLGDEQCGYMYSCADEGENVIRLNFTQDDFAGMTDSVDLSDFRVDLYLCYSDFKGDDAVLQAMYGNTGENEFLTSLTIPAEYGQTYTYQLTGNRQDGYTLEEVK